MNSDPFFRARANGITVLAEFFVAIAVGLVVARPPKALRGSRQLVAQGTSLAANLRDTG